ncbi:unnamed protein product [Dovyalis caffra]|uniref:Uncharacterized protein n=1 Tax=Dovyalis caffra TaxID=77055 RepID=A0AAV1S3W7_9ROSI|nr:unnamed protein product [Dovyalis caffra]
MLDGKRVNTRLEQHGCKGRRRESLCEIDPQVIVGRLREGDGQCRIRPFHERDDSRSRCVLCVREK